MRIGLYDELKRAFGGASARLSGSIDAHVEVVFCHRDRTVREPLDALRPLAVMQYAQIFLS